MKSSDDRRFRWDRARSVPTIPGKRFGRLTILSKARPVFYRGNRINRSRCRCICGAMLVVKNSALKTGNTSSCGCLQRERQMRAVLKHGFSSKGKKAPEYQAWAHMIQRCYNKKDQGYRNYGNRGISVCAAWRLSFSRFIKDVGRRPSEHHSLDRINNDLGYSPGNVRWATRSQQARNTRHNVYLTHAGKRLCIQEWSAVSGMRKGTIVSRLRRGWTVSETLTLGLRRGLRPSRKIV